MHLEKQWKTCLQNSGIICIQCRMTLHVSCLDANIKVCVLIAIADSSMVITGSEGETGELCLVPQFKSIYENNPQNQNQQDTTI